MNISIANRYCNRCIHIGRPVFPVNHDGVSVYNPTFGIAHARVAAKHEKHRSPNLRPDSDHRWSMLTISSTHNVSNNCIYSQFHLVCLHEVNCNWFITMKGRFFSQHQPPTTPLLLWLHDEFNMPPPPPPQKKKGKSHKDIRHNLFPHLDI